MADQLPKGFQADALVLINDTGIVAGSNDPSISGEVATVGSLYVRDTGQLWQKTSAPDTGWEIISSSSYNGNSTETADANAAANVLIFVDTTLNAVTITLPVVASYTNKFFFIKWTNKSMGYKCTLAAQTGETIDGETSHIYGELYDSLQVVSDGTEWFII